MESSSSVLASITPALRISHVLICTISPWTNWKSGPTDPLRKARRLPLATPTSLIHCMAITDSTVIVHSVRASKTSRRSQITMSHGSNLVESLSAKMDVVWTTSCTVITERLDEFSGGNWMVMKRAFGWPVVMDEPRRDDKTNSTIDVWRCIHGRSYIHDRHFTTCYSAGVRALERCILCCIVGGGARSVAFSWDGLEALHFYLALSGE